LQCAGFSPFGLEKMLTLALSLLVAALHLWFLIIEMFLWQSPRTRTAFGTTEGFAAATRVLAANQGLYNGFLAAGIVFSLWLGVSGRPSLLFFLACVIVAGVYGAATVGVRILFVQAVPGALALAAALMRV
jgi:putative membrane protein